MHEAVPVERDAVTAIAGMLCQPGDALKSASHLPSLRLLSGPCSASTPHGASPGYPEPELQQNSRTQEPLYSLVFSMAQSMYTRLELGCEQDSEGPARGARKSLTIRDETQVKDRRKVFSWAFRKIA